MSFGRFLLGIVFFTAGYWLTGVFGFGQIMGSIWAKMYVNRNAIFFADPFKAMSRAKAVSLAIVVWSIIIIAIIAVVIFAIQDFYIVYFLGLVIGTISVFANRSKFLNEFVESCGGLKPELDK